MTFQLTLVCNALRNPARPPAPHSELGPRGYELQQWGTIHTQMCVHPLVRVVRAHSLLDPSGQPTRIARLRSCNISCEKATVIDLDQINAPHRHFMPRPVGRLSQTGNEKRHLITHRTHERINLLSCATGNINEGKTASLLRFAKTAT